MTDSRTELAMAHANNIRAAIKVAQQAGFEVELEHNGADTDDLFDEMTLDLFDTTNYQSTVREVFRNGD